VQRRHAPDVIDKSAATVKLHRPCDVAFDQMLSDSSARTFRWSTLRHSVAFVALAAVGCGSGAAMPCAESSSSVSAQTSDQPSNPTPVAEPTVRLASDPSAGTSGTQQAAQGDAIVVPAPSAKEARGLKRLRVLERGAMMPTFRVQIEGGEMLDSSTLVGREPFVVAFFTSWCPVCERKMPVVRHALDSFGQDSSGKAMFALGVGMDEDDTWKNVPPYIKRHQIAFRPVRGLASAELVDALNLGGSFPVLYVVGRDGRVIDVQIGLKPDHAHRLEQALRLATQTN